MKTDSNVNLKTALDTTTSHNQARKNSTEDNTKKSL